MNIYPGLSRWGDRFNSCMTTGGFRLASTPALAQAAPNSRGRTMKLAKILGVMLFLGVFCVSLPGRAEDKQPFPLAVVSSQAVLFKSDQGVQIAKDLEAKFGDRRKQLAKDEQELVQLKKEADAPKASESKAKAFTAKRDKLVAESRKFQLEVRQAELTAFKPVGDKLRGILQDYLKEKGLKGIQERTGFVVVDPSLDITDEMIKRMNQK